MSKYKLGLDIGSTTVKAAVIDEMGELVFSVYNRHHADIAGSTASLLSNVIARFGDVRISTALTGSVGMGLSHKTGITFVQEVVAATRLVKQKYPQASTLIDIGGEDAKIVYLKPDGSADLRMNSNCAGGTGAFIDQMAILLGIAVEQMSELATHAQHIYPIASRCGVFAKTDIQNLISKNTPKEDLCASIFHAIAVQTVVTLSHGCNVTPKIFFCGGPLTFIPALQDAFIQYLKLPKSDFLTASNGNIITAWGTALSADATQTFLLSELAAKLAAGSAAGSLRANGGLQPIFASEAEYEAWKVKKGQSQIRRAALYAPPTGAYLGVDSGSTTTKMVLMDDERQILFSHYASNEGDPVSTVKKGLEKLADECRKKGLVMKIKASTSTGYGEDLIKAAFNLRFGIIETIAHYLSAKQIHPQVSFVLDIGGQDMKALFVEKGVLNRMELNEACSSGCGSFLETFCKSLNYTLPEFTRAACLARNPCDLGTRCTVFMNSKVKQALHEGAGIDDIAAGLSYSVVKNCLYKVLKLRDTAELGGEIVVQGGTLRNDSVVRVLELLCGRDVYRSDMPELMGAYGCALHAQLSCTAADESVPLEELNASSHDTVQRLQCSGCENQCLVSAYTFGAGNRYYCGNKCEKMFINKGTPVEIGENIYAYKYAKLFERTTAPKNALTIGIPRALNMYEEYPFWFSLFSACGFNVRLSDPSTFKNYEEGVHSVMSDNICFPAKLMHSHIYNLINHKADRIFLPYVVHERAEGKKVANSYNCPVVSGYSDVIKSVIPSGVPIDSPVITFKEEALLRRGCREYLESLGVAKDVIRTAFKQALAAQKEYEQYLRRANEQIYHKSQTDEKLTILLAGRPYHADPLVQHKLSEMIVSLGVNVISEDIVRGEIASDENHLTQQWAYVNRILKAAEWAAQRGEKVHFIQMTSFGCGPDAFLTDALGDLLKRHGKILTVLKIDDVSNIGSLRLRVRSLVESCKFSLERSAKKELFVTTKKFKKQDRKRKILIPFLDEYVSPVLGALCALSGHDVEVLPVSDMQSAQYGLTYANNEVCYPATLVVGDIIKALKSGRYNPEQIAVMISQTGGQCRASNYIALIKRAMVAAGFKDVPVVSLGFAGGVSNEQPGFKMDWLKILPIGFFAMMCADCLSQFYHATVVRERLPGEAKRLKEIYLAEFVSLIVKNNVKGLLKCLSAAAKEFDEAVLAGKQLYKVGLVGEIYLKFNPFANKDVGNWFMQRQIEVVPPGFFGFFMQSFVNSRIRNQLHLQKKRIPNFVTDMAYSMALKQVKKVNSVASSFRYFTPFSDIFEEAENGKEIVSLAGQFGEGWLLPAEVVSFAKRNVNNVVSLQPFGCIANHIVSKGVEKKIKTLYPQLNLLSLDYDSGVSEVNIINRLMLFANNLK